MDIIIGDKHIKYLFNMTKNVPIKKFWPMIFRKGV